MSEAHPAELSAAFIVGQIERGEIARDLLLSFARGFLPLERDEMITVLAYLASRDDDEEVVALARASLTDVPSRLVIGLASDEGARPEVLRNLSRATLDAAVLEALIRNRALPDEAVAELARSADPAVQEVIVINQTRILRSRAILDALLENPKLSADARRRALETREEFFDKKERARVVELGIDEELIDEPLDAIADLLEAAKAEQDAAPTPPIPVTEAEKAEPKTQALFARILSMSVAEKVLLAFRGDRTARLLLVRDRNRLVCSAAIRNPRMTETEAEMIAGSRNVEDEVLRIIGMKRDWMSKYNILVALCRNPRAPVGVVLSAINRLTLRDLKGLKDDKGVTEVVRATARRAFAARTQKS